MSIRNFFYILFIITILNNILYSQFTLQDAFPNLTFQRAVDLQNAGDLTDRLFVVDQLGVIKVLQNDAATISVKNFLDITDRVDYGGERGLLGLAFHPEYKNNGFFYVNYTAPNPLRTVISRFQVSSTNPDSVDENTELIILTYLQPQSNHNGGCITFGPDGYLYISSGDGGVSSNAQEITNLLGKILRIDIDNPQPPNNYGIPDDNPFIDSVGVNIQKEIYALGLRNPWRMSFDSVTGLSWAGDVGENNWEEIDIIENGKNYGWVCYEGNHENAPIGCNGIYEFPIWEYSHSVGFAITGGYVYRGPNIPELYGKYIYGDYVTTKVWSLDYDGINPAVNTFLTNVPGALPSFGVDENQELYLLSFNGKIYKFTPTAPIIAPSYLRINSTVPGEIDLLWKDNSNNESGFIIERQTGTSESFVVLDSVLANVTSFSDVISDTSLYIYRVKAFNATNQSGYSNQASINVAIVPVELTLFSGKYEDGVVNLKWITATETNNFGFDVQRRNDNSSYESIGFVNGNGTSTNRLTYNFVDDNLSASKYYYRLKQIDLDGLFEYSNEVEINIDALSDFQLYQNYPNPFNPITKISFQLPKSTNVKISIINPLGETVKTLVNEFKQSGFYEIDFNASDFPSGIYFYNVLTPEYSNTKKMILLK